MFTHWPNSGSICHSQLPQPPDDELEELDDELTLELEEGLELDEELLDEELLDEELLDEELDGCELDELELLMMSSSVCECHDRRILAQLTVSLT